MKKDLIRYKIYSTFAKTEPNAMRFNGTYEVIQQILFLGVRYRVDKETTYLTLAYFSIYESSDIRWYTSSENTEILNAQNTDSSKMLALALFAISSKFNDIYNVSIEQLTRSFGEKY